MGLLDDVMDGINGKEGAAPPPTAAGAETPPTAEKKGAFEYSPEFAAHYGKAKQQGA
jgi:hypothetical protein